jgi:hypothetical protein
VHEIIKIKHKEMLHAGFLIHQCVAAANVNKQLTLEQALLSEISLN